MNLDELLEKRKSIRQYESKKVDRHDIIQMIDAAIMAPTWKNSQVIRYYVVEDEKMLSQVKAALPEFNYENTKDAPVLIVSTVVLNRSGFNRDGTPTTELGNEWGFYDCGLQHMNLLLKASELGLSTLIMGVRDADQLKSLLNIPETEAVSSVISVGYSDFSPVRPPRKSVEDITKFF